VQSGAALTAADIEGCKSTQITMSVTCDDNSTVLRIVTVDGVEWVLLAGQPAVKRPSDTSQDRTLCP